MSERLDYAGPENPDAATAAVAAPKGALLSIFLIVLVDFLGFGLIIPLLPFYVPDYARNPMKVTLIFSIFSICQFIGAPVLGALSDRFGRRPASVEVLREPTETVISAGTTITGAVPRRSVSAIARPWRTRVPIAAK